MKGGDTFRDTTRIMGLLCHDWAPYLINMIFITILVPYMYRNLNDECSVDLLGYLYYTVMFNKSQFDRVWTVRTTLRV